ncbi:S-protein homolog 5-like [Prosopis cineraria]|uniref:S-protein homolog 5-like n=1 Tax=Prosopis cineraria TaxID=364024 RepID=UPI00240ED1C1|nr:S-protein homolog 5-like [Prosopis cineraria]
MAPSMKHLLLLLTIAAAISVKSGKASLFPKRTTVQIINNLSNHQNLTLHCKDKEFDLSEHWPSDTSFHYFDIYIEERDYWCEICTWKIKESGPCQNQCFPWNHDSKQQSTISPVGFVALSDIKTAQSRHT